MLPISQYIMSVVHKMKIEPAMISFITSSEIADQTDNLSQKKPANLSLFSTSSKGITLVMRMWESQENLRNFFFW